MVVSVSDNGIWSFAALGTPAPQGSKRFVGSKNGKGRMIESSQAVKPWREAVKEAARGQKVLGAPCLDGPLVVAMVFTFARPKSHFRTGRNAHILRDDAPVAPMGAPDLSKLARSTEDAITDAGLWVDDARVAEYCRLAKVYAGDEHALDVPGVIVACADIATIYASRPNRGTIQVQDALKWRLRHCALLVGQGDYFAYPAKVDANG